MNTSKLLVLAGAMLLAACGDNSNLPGDSDGRPRADGPPVADGGDEPDGSTIDGSTIDGSTIDAGADAAVDAVPPPAVLNANGGFETGDMTGWVCNGNAACTVINTDLHSGTYSASAVTLPNDYSGFRINVLPLVCPTDPTCLTGTTLLGRTLRFDAFMKNVGAATQMRLVLRWSCQDTGANGYDWLINIDNPTADVWTEYDATFVIPDCDYAASDGNLYLYTGTVGATEFHMDDMAITDVTPI